MSDGLRDAAQRRGSFLHALRAVAWSFFGIRKGSEYNNDVSRLYPLHVIAAGIVAALLFIVVLMVLVNWVVGSGVAG